MIVKFFKCEKIILTNSTINHLKSFKNFIKKFQFSFSNSKITLQNFDGNKEINNFG